ncbi:transmembrane protein, putative (macronuclear) [Tetrahymena thermophila SB210]|uniref:Transmembrane protein, putative n=1 Tax=Tetrahymena thermophila (strain SB210) TaxID=312017 RepID=W7XJJ2_TETTS|nr:transmembrane protein, putative [Tetrahymena thermophila SB210]EWS74209.1 transmembrane protein, putative [Tetrahymena thermophila SB210]|eukprot:XP_012653269.1 transmembrane protein, putative [Tetrahymena thermophila SB210]
MSCTSAYDCQECYSIYELDKSSQICACKVSNIIDDCEKPKQGYLLQYSRYMSDYRSIEVVFNQMINIIGEKLIDQFDAQSSTNSKLSVKLDQKQFFSNPIIDLNKISIQIKQNQIVDKQIFNLEEQQQNYLTELEYFDLNYEKMISNIKLSITSPQQQTGKLDIQGQDIYYTDISTQDYEGPITIRLECSLFNIKTVDTITVYISFLQNFSQYVYSSTLDKQQNSLIGSLDNKIQQKTSFFQNTHYWIRIQTIPQIMETQMIPISDKDRLQITTIPAYSAKYTQVIFVIQEVINSQGFAISRSNLVYLNYNIQYIPNIEKQMNNVNPQNEFWIEVDITQFQIAESKSIDPQYTSQSWICSDENNQPCINIHQQPLYIDQQGNKMKLNKNQLLLNTDYFFFYQFESKKYQFSYQFQKFSVNTGQTYAYATIQGQQGDIINIQDFINIIIYIHTDFPYQIEQALYKLTLIQNGLEKTLTSVTNQFSFQIQDYFPNPDFSQNPTTLSISYSVYDYLFQQTIFIQDLSKQFILKISPPDLINIKIQNQMYVAFKDMVQIECLAINSKIIQFFYYNSAEDREFELQNPYQTTRKLLSLDQIDYHVKTYLPSGDIVIMALGFDEQKNQYTNVTYALNVNDNHFSQQQYVQFIEEQYNLALSYQQLAQFKEEILLYQNIIETIEQFEKRDQILNQVLAQIKQNILERLSKSVWQYKIDQIFNLSGEITLRIIRTQIQLDSNLFNLILSQTENRIQQLYSSVQNLQSQINTKIRFQYQESFRITIQTYMELVKISGNSYLINEERITQNTFSAIYGMSLLLHTNQSPVNLLTSTALIQAEKFDDVLFMSNYQWQSTINQDSFLNLNQFYVLTQCWPNNTFLYRDELKQFNKKYLAYADESTLPLLLITYTVKIPKVIKSKRPINQDKKGRFLEETNSFDQPNNFIISFTNVTQNQQLQCIQRNSQGKWVNSSCKTSVVMKNNQWQIQCICQTPDVTSIIADAEALLQNDNLSEIFSQSGLSGLSKLKNWYKYVVIWTIILLNIFYICLACIAKKFDKRDRVKLSNLQQQTEDQQKLFYQDAKKKQKIFIFIKARKSTLLQLQNCQEKENNLKEKQLLQQPNINSDFKQQEIDEAKSFQIQDKRIISIQSLRYIENNQMISNNNIGSKRYNDQLCTEKQTLASLNNQNDSYFKQNQNHFAIKEEEQIKNKIEIHQPGEEKQSLQESLKLKVLNELNDQQIEQKNKENTEINQNFQLQYHLKDVQQSPKNKTQHYLDNVSFNSSKKKEDQQQQNRLNQKSQQSKKEIKINHKKIREQEKKELKKIKYEMAKQKLVEYLDQEKTIFGILSFHQFFSIFFIYQQNQSRVLRSSIFYNKMVWLLTLNSIFGRDLSFAQIFILSIISSIVLWIVTNIISIFLKFKKLFKIGIFFVFVFCLFCYYCILVAISRSTIYQSNIWVISYFAMLVLNEFVFGILKQIKAEHIDQYVSQNLYNRNLQSCQKNCAVCNFDGFCLKCNDLRVFPNCDCQIGYYENSGTCLPCKSGCMSCTSASTCSQCYSIYTIDSSTQNCNCNMPSIGGTCELPNQGTLLYQARLLDDLSSIQVIFNQMIQILGLASQSSQFTPSPNNCIIFDTTTLSNYGCNNINNCQCFVDSLNRNKVVINFILLQSPSFTNPSLFFINPVIDITKIQILINQNAVSVQNIYNLESQIGVQINQRIKLGYFAQTNYIYQYSADPNNPLAYVLFSDQRFAIFSVLTCTVKINSPPQYTSISLQIDTSQQNYYRILFSSDPQINDTIIVALTCQYLNIQNTDIATIQISTTKQSTVNYIQPQLQANGNQMQSALDSIIGIIFNNFQQSSFQLISTFYPPIIPQQVVWLDPSINYSNNQNAYSVNIPAFSAKIVETIFCIFKVLDNQNNLLAVAYIQYQNMAYQTIQDPKLVLDKQTPLTDFWITVDTSQFSLSQSKTIDPNYQQQSWFCVDQDNKPCQDIYGNKLKIIDYGNQMKVPKNSIQINKKYIFYYLLQSIQYPQYSKQYQTFTVGTGVAYSMMAQTVFKVNIYDVIYNKILVHTDFSYQIGKAQYSIQISNSQNQKVNVVSISNQICFVTEDYFPLLDFTNSPTLIFLTFSVFDYYFNTLIPMQDPTQPIQIEIQPPAPLNIQIQQQAYNAFTDLITITCNPADNTQYYQFFYYNSQNERDLEIKFPYQPRRKMISIMQLSQQVQTLLPPGNIVIMAMAFNPSNYLYTNVTQNVFVSNVDFNQGAYVNFIQTQYSKAQQFQGNNQNVNELQVYSIIIEAIERYEQNNISPLSVEQIKSNILIRLTNAIWYQQLDDVFNLSGQITYRMISTQWQYSAQSFKQIQIATETRIQTLYNWIQQQYSSLSYSQQLAYKLCFISSMQTYMQLINLNAYSDVILDTNIVQYTIEIMSGLSYLLKVNQSPINLQSDQASLLIERYDIILFMDKYYQQFISDPTPIQVAQSFYVLTQTWGNNTFLYRQEINQLNQQYQSKANSTTQALLNITYPIKIPTVFTDQAQTNFQSRRDRVLQTNAASLPNNFILDFGTVNEQQVKCIQRSQSGQWVSNSCQVQFNVVNNKRNVKCVCSTPTATSILADAEALLNNQNLQNIFSEGGIQNISKLNDWYDYVAIWTMLGLNIILIFMLHFVNTIDKKDFQTIQQFQVVNTETYIDTEKQNQNRDQRRGVFIMIKAKNISEYSNLFEDITSLQKLENKLETQQLLKEKSESQLILQNQQTNLKIELIQKQTSLEQDKQNNDLFQKKQADSKEGLNETQKDKEQKLNGEHEIQTDREINLQNQKNNNKQQSYSQEQNQPNSFKVLSTVAILPKENQNTTQKIQPDEENMKNLTDQQNEEERFSVNNDEQTEKSKINKKPSKKNSSKVFPVTSKNEVQEKQQEGDIEDKKEDLKALKEQEQKKKEIVAKEKFKEYLQLEKFKFGVFAFHQLFSIFTVYNEDQSRIFRFVIFYNKLVWLLTLNSIFGKNLSVVQVIILSIVTTIVLQIVTNIVEILLRYKKLRKLGLLVVSLFCLFCYYSILVVIAGESAYESNLWIISYFATLIVNELILGILISAVMFYLCRRFIKQIKNNMILELLGAGVLLQAFSKN